MPATVETDPPGIWCMFSDGSTVRFSLDGLPCPGLAEDLLTGLAGLIHPHGRVDAAGTAGVYIRAFREMTRTLAAAGFTGRAADLRRPHLTGYWMGTTADRESCTRRALAAFARDGGTTPSRSGRAGGGPELQPGVLPQAAAALPRGRMGTSCRDVRSCRRCLRSPLTRKRWPRPPGEASRARTGGPGRTSPGCWPGPARSGRSSPGSWPAAHPGWPAGRAASRRSARTCSRRWTR